MTDIDVMQRRQRDAGVTLLRQCVDARDGEGAASALDSLFATDPEFAGRLLEALNRAGLMGIDDAAIHHPEVLLHLIGEAR